jgi:hypothetical protein
MTPTSPLLTSIFLSSIGLALVHAHPLPLHEPRLGFLEPPSLSVNVKHDVFGAVTPFTPSLSKPHQIYRRSPAPLPPPAPKQEKNPRSSLREDQLNYHASQENEPPEFELKLPNPYLVDIHPDDPDADILEQWNKIAPTIGRANDYAVRRHKDVQEFQRTLDDLEKDIGRTPGTGVGADRGTESGSEIPKTVPNSETEPPNEKAGAGIESYLKYYREVHRTALVPAAEKAAEDARKVREMHAPKAKELLGAFKDPNHPVKAVIEDALNDPLRSGKV